MKRKACRQCKKYKNIEDFNKKNDNEHKATCKTCEEKSSIKGNLNKLIKEQELILKYLHHGYNIKVNAVAGSGKTTCILHVGKQCGASKICVITYNKKLQDETQKKLVKYDINNIDIFTYHGSCNRKYINKRELITDYHIKATVEEDIKTTNINYDIIIIDEVQDMNQLYCDYIKKFLRDNKSKDPNIIILGDENQCINQYNGSDERFLTMGDEIFLNENEWKSHKLSSTFRVPQEICDFLNNCMLEEERMISNDGKGNPYFSGYKPRYFLKSSFTNIDNGSDYVLREIEYYLNFRDEKGNKKYKPDDIFILAPSVKKKDDNQSPVNKLANAISWKYNKDILIYVNNDTDCMVEDKIYENKIVFSTHNSVKGLERKVVIILNFDKSYFDYYDKESNPNVCPNRLYVAVTRSMERLSLFHHYEDDYLPFLSGKTRSEKETNIRKYCDVNPTGVRPGKLFTLDIKEKDIDPPCYSVTDLVKHLQIDVLLQLSGLYTKIKIKSSGKHLDIIGTSEQKKNHWEIVSDINGTAIPLYFSITECGCVNPTDEKLDGINDNVTILRMANIMNANVDNSYYKVNQIVNYNWLDEHVLNEATDRLKNLKKEGLISEIGTFEHYSEINSETCNLEKIKFTLKGQMDYANKQDKIVFEFKCVEKLDDSHFLQTLLYNYINGDDYDKYYLYNIKNDELYQVSSTQENLQEIVDILINNKKHYRISNEDFRKRNC